MLVVECIPFKGFKEKIAITKKYNNYSNCKCEVIGNFVYVERKITAQFDYIAKEVNIFDN